MHAEHNEPLSNSAHSTVSVSSVMKGEHMHFDSVEMLHREKADMASTFLHQTDNNISHHSLQSMHSVQNVTDD